MATGSESYSLHTDISAIYEIFGVDAFFQPRLNLIDKLVYLADQALNIDVGHQNSWQHWKELLSTEAASLRRRKLSIVSPDPKIGNPINIRLSPHRIAAAFLQESLDNRHPDLSTKYQGQLILLLITLMNLPPNQATEYDDIADEIRLSMKPHSKRQALLKTFPIPSADSLYLDQMEKHLNNLKLRHFSSLESGYISAVQRLLETTIRITQEKPEGSLKPPSVISTPRIDTKPIPLLPDDNSEDGDLVQLPITLDIDQEPNDPEWLYIPTGDPEAEPASLEEQDAEARRSRYWLRHAANRCINDTAILTPIERQVLSRYFRAHLDTPEITHKSPFCLIVALMYATASNIDELLQASISESGLFTPTGIYRRHLPPIEGYCPNDTGNSSPVFNMIELELPSIVQSWFRSRADCFLTEKTLGDILGLDEKSATVGVKKLLAEMRNNGRYRIKLSRITAGLPAELSARIQNAAITYLLTGRPDQAMPTLLYYQQLTPPMLQTAYHQVIHTMFSDD